MNKKEWNWGSEEGSSGVLPAVFTDKCYLLSMGPCPFAWDFQETVGLREGWNRRSQEVALYSVQVDCHGVGGGDGVLARRDVQCVGL